MSESKPTQENPFTAASGEGHTKAVNPEKECIVQDKSKKERKVQVSLWMTESQRKKVKRYALEHDTNVSQLFISYINSLEE